MRSALCALALAMLAAGFIPAELAGQQRVDTMKVAVPVRMTLNIPATRLDIWEADSLARSYRVAVGTRQYPTPLGDFQISELTWNPWWVPPPSDWARNERAQPPGPHNNMGRVKLKFGDYLYLHGTPFTSSIGRAASHGCVRMRNDHAIDLAQYLLNIGGPKIAPERLNRLVEDTTATQRILLGCKVPLAIRYDVVEVRDSMLEVHTDVYRRGVDVRREALAVLAAHGYAQDVLDLARLDSFLKQRRPDGRIPLCDLLRARASAKSR